VGSILKALGLTIWGLVAIGLLAIFIFVGYETAIRYRTSSGTLVDERTTNDQSRSGQLGSSGGVASSAPMNRTNDLPNASPPPRTTEATRKLLLDAVRNGEYQSAITLGQQLADGNSAAPGDLVIVARSYSSVGDCEKARIWAQRARDAFQAAGSGPDESLRRVIACCGPGLNKTPVTLDAAQIARIDRLLSKTDAAKADSGDPFVNLGELYYGFNEYELAIASIQRGLKMGKVARPEDAYVYLGLSEQKVGDLENSRNAFGKLKDVPGISPKVLKLWTLYAETQLTKSENSECTQAERADYDSNSASEDQLPGSGR